MPAGTRPETDHCQLITVKALAALLHVHERTCWRLATEAEAGRGTFPAPLKIGPKTIRWRLSDVQAYIAGLLANGNTPKNRPGTSRN